ncbi:ABC-F family ATP-binding cassette domain-containing protein [Arthrobacter sp. MYb227]|uniref:ABC-F family ATP-binding cassette domain-containing protein n=1 Tax=Arthrobacter sp. MYb227 TaxID=1848601 RepID=UPI0015E28145|nr:ABC-F family ATP-binding cassette domain-containing protein [Arthrobacter sp. MYb227]
MTPQSFSPFSSRFSCQLRAGTVRYGDRLVFTELDLIIGATDRLALIGENGAGKSTLLGVLAGTVELNAGDLLLDIPGGLAIAEQRPMFCSGTTVSEALDLLLAQLRDIENRIQLTALELAQAPESMHPVLIKKLGQLSAEFEARDGYGLEIRLDAALDQLGLGGLDRQREVAELSGGQRARLGLAAALSSEPALLLLDEPTNDLDEAGLNWLEERLTAHRGALVAVSHDRTFLRNFATDIVNLHEGKISRYGNGYEGYLSARAIERERMNAERLAWEQELERNQELVAANTFRLAQIPQKMEKAGFGHGAFRMRGRDHGAKSRIRMAKERLDRLERNPAPRPADPLRFVHAFTDDELAPTMSEPILRAESICLDAASRPALSIESLEISAGDRFLVSGKNGAGKTTLLRLLQGEYLVQHGILWRRKGLRIAHLRQEMREGSNLSDSTLNVVAAFAGATKNYRDEAIEILLRTGLLRPDELMKPLSALSLGQRRRFDLAIALSVPSDLLLLDEPTNHLAPELVEELEIALAEYPGAVLSVSHDRTWRERFAVAGMRQVEVLVGGKVLMKN